MKYIYAEEWIEQHRNRRQLGPMCLCKMETNMFLDTK